MVVLDLALICCIILAAVLLVFISCTLYNGNGRSDEGWKTCSVTFSTLNPAFIFPFRHMREISVKVYVADAPEKLYEGYRFKTSYDFLGKGARGMLLDVRQFADYTITITMQDVRLPLFVFVIEKSDGAYVIMQYRKLYPEENWDIKLPKNSPLVLELDPSIGEQIANWSSTFITLNIN